MPGVTDRSTDNTRVTSPQPQRAFSQQRSAVPTASRDNFDVESAMSIAVGGQLADPNGQVIEGNNYLSLPELKIAYNRGEHSPEEILSIVNQVVQSNNISNRRLGDGNDAFALTAIYSISLTEHHQVKLKITDHDITLQIHHPDFAMLQRLGSRRRLEVKFELLAKAIKEGMSQNKVKRLPSSPAR